MSLIWRSFCCCCCDWTRLGCRLARNLQGRFYMAPSWSTCDPLSCFFNPPPLHHSSLPLYSYCCPLILRSERAASLIAALPLIAMQRQTMDPATSSQSRWKLPSAFPTVCVFGFGFAYGFRFRFCHSHSTAKAARNCSSRLNRLTLTARGGGEGSRRGAAAAAARWRQLWQGAIFNAKKYATLFCVNFVAHT